MVVASVNITKGNSLIDLGLPSLLRIIVFITLGFRLREYKVEVEVF